MLTGDATVPLTVQLDVNGLAGTDYDTDVAKVAKVLLYTDGYELTSRLTMTASNSGTGTLVGACYACEATTCTDQPGTGYCHQVTPTSTSVTDMAKDTHTVKVAPKAAITAGLKASDATASPAVVGKYPGAQTGLTNLLEGAALRILAPVANTGSWVTLKDPKTLGCLGCLVVPPTTVVTGWETKGMLVARWYQPTQGTATTTSGPRFNLADPISAWAVTGNGNVVKTAAAVKITKGGLSLAAAVAGVAAGAAALAM